MTRRFESLDQVPAYSVHVAKRGLDWRRLAITAWSARYGNSHRQWA